MKGKNQYFEAHYREGVKHGPYRKTIGNDYEEQGNYDEDQMHGQVKIRKGEFNGRYNYDRGNKLDEQSNV